MLFSTPTTSTPIQDSTDEVSKLERWLLQLGTRHSVERPGATRRLLDPHLSLDLPANRRCRVIRPAYVQGTRRDPWRLPEDQGAPLELVLQRLRICAEAEVL